MSTPAVENPAATTSMHGTGGIDFSDPPVVPKMQLKPAVHENNMPKPVKGDYQKESKSQPLTFVSSISTPSTVMPNVSSATVNESLAAIMSSMERISASHDLPEVQKFDGSPQQYPSFRQRFDQLVEAKPLDDAVKTTRLLQFLEGPVLLAVQRYETLPGGFAKAFKTLDDRFGEPFQVVRASVERVNVMPTFKDVVDFFKERAFIMNHPFFSAERSENVVTRVKSGGKLPVTPKSPFFVNMTAAKGAPCPTCHQPHRLYQCEAFKSLSTRGPGRRDTCHLTDFSQTFTDD